LREVLGARYSDADVKVDEATANPARICKLYGTMACKGDSMPARPHRRSALLEIPERIDPVPIHALEALASEVADALPTKLAAFRSGRPDIDKWLAQAGLEIVERLPAFSR
jgi:hypothetical protein